MLRPAVAVMNCAITAEASGVGIGKRAPVGKRSLERKPDPAMPGVTGFPRCPAGGNPSTTAGKQRYRRGFRRCRPCAAASPEQAWFGEAAGHRARQTLNWRPGMGRGGILTARGWNPKQIAAFCPYIKSSGGHYDDGRAEHWRRRGSLLLKLVGF